MPVGFFVGTFFLTNLENVTRKYLSKILENITRKYYSKSKILLAQRPLKYFLTLSNFNDEVKKD